MATETTNSGDTTNAGRTLQRVTTFETWLELAHTAYERLAEEFAGLKTEDWTRPTPCEGWTIRDLGGHVLGAMRAAASLRELASQQREIARRAKDTGMNQTDAMTAVQIDRTEDVPTDELVDEMSRLVAPAIRGRGRIPGVLRRRIGFEVEVPGVSERWTLDYLNGCILTRDAWLHRFDLTDAIGATPTVDDVDHAIVADVAVEWASRHGEPVDLTLTGPAGGTLTVGSGGPSLELDAIAFCKVLSGRGTHPHPLMSTLVPF